MFGAIIISSKIIGNFRVYNNMKLTPQIYSEQVDETFLYSTGHNQENLTL